MNKDISKLIIRFKVTGMHSSPLAVERFSFYSEVESNLVERTRIHRTEGKYS